MNVGCRMLYQVPVSWLICEVISGSLPGGCKVVATPFLTILLYPPLDVAHSDVTPPLMWFPTTTQGIKEPATPDRHQSLG